MSNKSLFNDKFWKKKKINIGDYIRNAPLPVFFPPTSESEKVLKEIKKVLVTVRKLVILYQI